MAHILQPISWRRSPPVPVSRSESGFGAAAAPQKRHDGQKLQEQRLKDSQRDGASEATPPPGAELLPPGS
ncbi:hypothetical protein EYF80_043738 [Liparis tanakae]|uniref:Uncharacterized protein n=1 Tax=Liparis tanakae TaxID=230148 RepID=A0A4Z2FXU2_9TELE|nr:hypothetical protein EYF80_043738 [Liparis tanakae]